MLVNAYERKTVIEREGEESVRERLERDRERDRERERERERKKNQLCIGVLWRERGKWKKKLQIQGTQARSRVSLRAAL